MDILISPQKEAPIYQQLYEQISLKILRGELKDGDLLPPIRTLAAELGISVITVKRAWEELERDGLILTQTGRGCFVRLPDRGKALEQRKALAKQHLEQELGFCRQMGMGPEEILQLVKECLEEEKT